MKSFRTAVEQEVGKNIERIFTASADPIEVRLENFPRYVRRQQLKRFLAMYEVFKLVLPVKGSVIDCGVFRGFSLMTWAKVSTILEPENLTRRIYGFDTFEGFPSVQEKDAGGSGQPPRGGMSASSYGELQALIAEYDRDRFVNQFQKVYLIRGDAVKTIPEFIAETPHLVVSLLFLDFDLYEPTRVAIESFLPRMPVGAVVAFDELDNPSWPGETRALLESVGIRSLELRRIEWDPYIAYAVLK